MSPNEKSSPQGIAIPKPTNLLCEYAVNPVGIDVPHPRFSWEERHFERGRTQSAYQILVATTRENLINDVGDAWNSGKVTSSSSVNIEYDGKPLESGRTYYWKVRWWDDKDRVSPYSKIATFEMGFLSQNDWKAKWIRGGNILRTHFSISRKVKRARAYICGLGYYELRINGRKVGDRQLDPGWTDYDKLVLYSTYDVTSLLKEGENAVGVMLGNGWYARKRSSDGSPKPPILILQIDLEFQDGSRKTIISDEKWKVSKGPIIENDIYNGETYDARLEEEGWDTPGYDDSTWKNAEIAEPPSGRLVSQAAFPPIKAVKTIQPISISNPKPGVYVYDFGQNFTGWVRLTVKGPRGAKVKLRYAELLHPDGTINTTPNRGAKATDTYILKGGGIEVYEPRFTYHGFRYVEVTGFPGTPNLDSLEGIVVHSAVESTGGFSCSNQLINKIHKNILWGQLSNLMSVPTDCPQRDERLGWMGDAQLTVEEAIYNFNMAAFYTKWIRDIKEAQEKDGSVPDVVPPYWRLYPADPAWGTACVTIPWHLYLYYGDKRILEENYDVMKGWVDFLGTKTEGYVVKFSKYGDWCPPGYINSPDTPGELVSTFYYYHDAMILSKVARLLGKSAEAERYKRLSEKIKEAFNKEFLKDDQYAPIRISSTLPPISSQTSNLLPLFLEIVPKDKEESVFKRLLENIVTKHDCHVATGIVGTRYLLDTLTKHGRADLAYKLVSQTTYPSWGYMIREDATTVWERWEYLTGGGMNSHNHIMFGSIDAWFYKALAGINIDPDAPGFERIIIKSHVVGDLKYVSASINTIRGKVSSSWRKEEDSLVLEVSLPVNSRGEVHIPDLGLKNPMVKEGGKIIWKNEAYVKGVPGITSGKREEGYIIFEVGSGTYSFQIE
mgnify:CR=1 FL=1